jgi:hypothetical protein
MRTRELNATLNYMSAGVASSVSSRVRECQFHVRRLGAQTIQCLMCEECRCCSVMVASHSLCAHNVEHLWKGHLTTDVCGFRCTWGWAAACLRKASRAGSRQESRAATGFTTLQSCFLTARTSEGALTAQNAAPSARRWCGSARWSGTTAL